MDTERVSIHAPVMDANLAELNNNRVILVSIHAPVMDANARYDPFVIV